MIYFRRLFKKKSKKYIYNIDLLKIDRLEVISELGRQYVNMSVKLEELSIQDKGKTLKIFIKHKQ